MIKTFTLMLGIVLLGVGVVGVITGGHDHQLIIFGINMTHNLVHILSGILAIIAAMISLNAAKMYCLLFGIVYGLVTIAGLMSVTPVVSMLNLNTADNYLHLGITAACLYYGLTAKTA